MDNSQGQIQQTIAELVRAAAPRYGIRDVDGFIKAMTALAGAESSWNPLIVGDNGASGGLFQLHERGQGAGMSMEDRQDPYKNIEKAITYLAPVFAAAETAGYSWEEGLRKMAGPDGQNPQDPEALYQNALAMARQLGGVAGGIAGRMGEQGMGGLGQAAAPTTGLGFGAWTEQNDPDFPWADRIRPDQPGLIGDAWLKTLTSQERAAKWERYNATVQQDGGTTEAEEARTALDWANVRRIIAELGGDTYEQGRDRILDQMDEKRWTKEQAISEFNAWMSAALEAGKRAETVYGEEMKRKTWTTPEKYYPGTEPGGRDEQMAARYGLEHTPSPGVPTSQLPDLGQMYGQWHQNMGISQQAPPTAGGWSGQDTGLSARNFLQRMNLRQGTPQGAGF